MHRAVIAGSIVAATVAAGAMAVEGDRLVSREADEVLVVADGNDTLITPDGNDILYPPPGA